MTDHFDGIFDNATPEDFTSTTSALAEHPLELTGEPYDQFIATQLAALRHAYAAADGAINPVAVLANNRAVRMFAPQDDEAIRDYCSRLSREAQRFGAVWLFIATKTRVGTVLVDADSGEAPNADNAEAMAVAESMGSTKEAVYWYSERRDRGATERRHGFLDIVTSDRLSDSVDGEIDQVVGPFAVIFGAES